MGNRLSSRLISLAALLALSSGLAAQTPAPAMRGSVTGFVFDPAAHGLRPILGIPGASILGDRIQAGGELEQAVVSAERNYALGVTRDGHDLTVILRLNGAISVQSYAAGTTPIDSIRLSPRGRAAVLYRRGWNTLQAISGLPDSPEFGDELDLTQLGGSLTAMAVNDRGVVLAAAVRGDSSAIFVFDTDGSARLISTVGNASALAYIDGRDAVVTDARDHKLYLLRNATGITATLPLAGEPQGLKSPAGVELSRDRRRAFVINSGSADVVAIDLADGTSARYACPCAPTGIEPLSGAAVFRLTELSDGPMWVFDGDLTEPRIVFVPGRGDNGNRPGSPAKQ